MVGSDCVKCHEDSEASEDMTTDWTRSVREKLLEQQANNWYHTHWLSTGGDLVLEGI